jgi:D-galacturonate reductase
VAVEYHKRFDPIYSDARHRIRSLGPFSHFASFMAQPKQQLATFSRWAGRASDISYYLNSHHIDFHHWSVAHMARPTRVTASAATGTAEQLLGTCDSPAPCLTKASQVFVSVPS